jgi:heme-degrading monooxygenase HmoA
VITIVWEFVVKEDALAAFASAYGPQGEWARLFSAFPGFLGTTLLRDRGNARRFLTLDRWESEAHFNRMKNDGRAEYERLDRLFGAFTESERKIGVFLTD